MSASDAPNFNDDLEGVDGFDSQTNGGLPADAIGDDLSGQPASRALAAYSDAPQFDRDEVVLPRLRVAQGLTAEVQDGSARPGQLVLGGLEPMDSLTVVPLRFARLRELRGEGDERQTILCQSSDAREGVGSPGGNCSTCPMAEWTKQEAKRGKDAKNLPPKCTLIFSYMVYVVEHQAIAVFEFRRTSERAGRLMNTMVAQRGLGKFAVKIGSEQKKEGQRTYSLPTLAAAAVDAVTLNQARAALG